MHNELVKYTLFSVIDLYLEMNGKLLGCLNNFLSIFILELEKFDQVKSICRLDVNLVC